MVSDIPAALRRAASLFFAAPFDVALLSSSEREDDFRMAATVGADGRRSVLKLAANAFTTPRRIEGWQTLIRNARSMDVYMPALIPSLAGRIAERCEIDGRAFVVWAEELAPYPLAQTEAELDTDAYREKDAARPKSDDGCPAWQTELIAFNAKLAAARLPGGWGMSGYVRLTPFDGEETDEAEECVLKFERDLTARFPALLSRWQTIRERWNENRDALAALYPRLPTSVFQADWNDTNVLLTDDGHFAGLIDYNIAGEDTALNMALSIGCYGFNAAGPLTAEEHAGKVLRLFGRERAWTDDEVAAAPLLWRYITALYWGEVNDLRGAGTEEDAARILDRIDEALAAEPDFRPAMTAHE
ncbi:MAG: hypothetical protein K6A33_03545 [Clostridiales bacterium]|nr:hypothetical protein [Clostridiales bacterium]